MAEIGIVVHPMQRRQRIGSKLLSVVLAAAREAGRRAVIVQTEARSSGPEFLSAAGFDKVHTLRYKRLNLIDLDTAALSRFLGPHHGYRTASWHGATPDFFAEAYAVARQVMSTAPMMGMHCGTVTWDADRVKTMTRPGEEYGDDRYTVVAIDVTDGSIVGYTELTVPADGKGDGRHHGTAVLPSHRGQGLGLWVKAKAISLAYNGHSNLAGLLTEAADSDAPMGRINDQLGYLLTHEALQYQLDLS
jgi:GNAT superfamily N-acetyltransferase